MATSSKPTRVRVTIACLVTVIAGTGLAACGTSKPKLTGTSGLGAVGTTGTPSTAPGTTGKPKPTPTPNPTVTVTTTDSGGNPVITLTAIQPSGIRSFRTGILLQSDYTITAQAPCSWYVDTDGMHVGATFTIGYIGLLFTPSAVLFQLSNNGAVPAQQQ